jgi:hypothetical protein
MQDGGRADLEEHVPDALLLHVERLRRVEDALVERRQTVDVLRQKRHVVHALNERHRTLVHDQPDRRWSELSTPAEPRRPPVSTTPASRRRVRSRQRSQDAESSSPDSTRCSRAHADAAMSLTAGFRSAGLMERHPLSAALAGVGRAVVVAVADRPQRAPGRNRWGRPHVYGSGVPLGMGLRATVQPVGPLCAARFVQWQGKALGCCPAVPWWLERRPMSLRLCVCLYVSRTTLAAAEV